MKKDHAEIAMVIDRSGSMGGLEDVVCKGFTTFLYQQVCVPGTANMTLVLFDDKYEVVSDGVPANTVPALTRETYSVRGFTALFDAMGKTINRLAQRIASMPQLEQPEHIIVAVTTDGAENSSCEFTASSLRALMDQKRAEGWEFIYMSANEEDWQPGVLGYEPKDISVYEPDEDGTFDSYITMSTQTIGYRGKR